MKAISNFSTVVRTVPTTSTPVAASGCTVGLDLGDRQDFVGGLDAAGNSVRKGFRAAVS